MQMLKKLGRNDKCFCGSKRKYKVCCLKKVEEVKQQQTALLEDGHDISSDKVQIVHDYLKENYSGHKVIDISNILNEETYRPIQTKHYMATTIMIAERNDRNESVFNSRGPNNVNLMVLYRGAYQCFEDTDFDVAKDKVDDMIEKRFSGEDL